MNKKTKNIIISNPKMTKLILKVYNYLLGRNKKIIRGKNNILNENIVLNKKRKIYIYGHNNIIKIGKFTQLYDCVITINGSCNVIDIGKRCCLNKAEFHIEDNRNEIIVGDNTTISGKTHLAAIEGTHISVGKDCMLSSNIYITTGDSHSVIDNKNNRINYSQNIEIGNHVWIGRKVLILKGSKINDNSIVAAGSLLCSCFNDENIIVGGNPAKTLKVNINWLRDRII